MSVMFWMKGPSPEYTEEGLGHASGICKYEPFSCRILIHPKFKESKGLLEHELVHYRQYKRLWFIHTALIYLSREYKLHIEIEAFLAEIEIEKKSVEWMVEALYSNYNLNMTKEYIRRRIDDHKGKDYCTLLPERIRGVFIGDCCKLHDNETGEKGSYNPLVAIKVFWDCLIEKVQFWLAVSIVSLGTVISIIRYPYFVYKKYKYRKNKGV